MASRLTDQQYNENDGNAGINNEILEEGQLSATLIKREIKIEANDDDDLNYNYPNEYGQYDAASTLDKLDIEYVKIEMVYSEDDESSSSLSDTPPKRPECDICGEIFRNYKDHENHLKIEHTPAERNKNLKPKKLFRCGECQKEFSVKSFFLRHIQTHSDFRPYKCQQCGLSFKVLCHLTGHLQVHSGLKPFKCEECGRAFSRSNCLKRHIGIHSGVKPFKCGECDKCFYRFQSLKRHSHVHAEVKPFQCIVCKKSFTRSCRLKAHNTTMHSEIKPYKCRQCDQSFTKAVALKIHVGGHSKLNEFSCEQCGKEFASCSDLHNHLSVHLVLKSQNVIEEKPTKTK